VLPGDIFVAAVADGASSAALGEVGARIAAWTAAATVRLCQQKAPWPEGEEAWRLCLIEAITTARVAVAAEAIARQVGIRELATTLILMVATSALVAVMQVGDGAVVVGDGNGNLVSLTVPQGGEYANETTFLISPMALATAQLRFWHGTPVYLAAFSDGLQRLVLKMPSGTPHGPFFWPLFHFLARVTPAQEAQTQLETLLRSQRVGARTDDDITLVLATLLR
jgi:serine/threonine protein phosphatase PrpC